MTANNDVHKDIEYSYLLNNPLLTVTVVQQLLRLAVILDIFISETIIISSIFN